MSGEMLPFGIAMSMGGSPGPRPRFSIYLPPEDLYEGRFFQHTMQK